jgi:hypothetical protein
MAYKRIFLDRYELERLYNNERLGIDAIAAKLGTSHGTVWRAFDRYGIPRRSLSEAHTRHPRQDFSGDKNEKAYLIGLRLGDLWVRKNKPGAGSKSIVVSCHTTIPEQVNLVESVFAPYGYVYVKRNPGGTLRVLGYLNLTFEFLLPKQDQIPAWIFGKSSWFLNFLGGYIDAEGSFCVPRNGSASFQLKTYDIHILEQIAHFLHAQLKIPCHPPRLAQKQGSPTGARYRLKKDAWTFSIARKDSLREFCILVAPYLKHKKRQDALRRVLLQLGS